LRHGLLLLPMDFTPSRRTARLTVLSGVREEFRGQEFRGESK
jgi:hypothetical protein